ncbi:hypothetical protein [Marinicella gelatinilytica]|uniref:hypothetical protein n=1 Tax=Marinicella gelatinilytica TaxID=2996017 RepID=UPI002260CA63|nr:hypothetical protein [Marinicella gelatinilytica]MCX7544182.1 hypothetical protein [Marinicella gelatinilytica]
MKTKLFKGLCLTLLSGYALADVNINAQLCNQSKKPVEFHFFNHNDIASGGIALATKSVQACSCVNITTHTDLWHNMPIARINQLVYRDVGSVSGTSIEVCLDAKGKFEGYIEGGVKTCAKAKKETSYLPAPELTRAQGDLKILESHLYAESTDCQSKDWTGGCVKYDANYNFTDGAACHGN